MRALKGLRGHKGVCVPLGPSALLGSIGNSRRAGPAGGKQGAGE